MVRMVTPIGNIGTAAADFELSGVDNKKHTLKNARGENGLLIMFLCNHCPYVQNIIDKLIIDAVELLNYGIKSIAIMPNDVAKYPQDSLDNMRNLSHQKNFPFPYTIDSGQEAARAYGALCTPDFFGFDKELKLKYRGRLHGPNNERELFNAMTTNNHDVQHQSEGCSIKWSENGA